MTDKKMKPVFTVDITQCYDELSVATAIALAKIESCLTSKNKHALITSLCDIIYCTAHDLSFIFTLESLTGEYNTIHFDGEGIIKMNLNQYDIDKDQKFECYSDGSAAIVDIKKPNVFKRFWNWITRKK